MSESRPDLSAQAIGSALYGLQKLSSDKLEVRQNHLFFLLQNTLGINIHIQYSDAMVDALIRREECYD